MKISEFSVKNYQFTLIMFVGVLSLGIFSLLNMPRGEDPEFISPQFLVVAVYPGTGPADMEELVVNPLEKSIYELDNIRRIRTDIEDGVAVLRVEYEYNSDPEEKYQELVREVNAAAKDLPADMYSLEVKRITPSDVNIYQFALVSQTAPYHRLQEYAENLKEELEKIRSLKNTIVWGYPEQQVSVRLRIERLSQYRLTAGRIIQAIQQENLNIPAGSISVGSRKFNVKTSGNYRSLEELGNTVVGSAGGKTIRLQDVANIALEYADIRHLTRVNGRRAVLITASQKDGQNIFAVRDQVVPALERFEKNLPPDMAFVRVFDQSESVGSRLNRFAKDFMIAIVLVLFTLLPLGYRASVVVMISIPLSLAIGLIMLNMFGFSINQLSIVGMIVALGILVDDSIVVVENIERYLRMGYRKRDAAIAATKQIGLAVLGCTATLCLAFMPLLFLPEASGDFIRSLPAAVIFTVLASMLVSLTIVPFLSSRILSEKEHGEGNIFMRGLQALISGSYGKLLDLSLKHPAITLLAALLIFGGSLLLIPFVGFSLFPRSEKPMFLVNIETPTGTNLAETDRISQQVEQVLLAQPELRNFTTNVGKGNPRIYYNVVQRREAENFAQLFVQLLPHTTQPEKEALIARLREQFRYVPNAKVEVKDFEQGPPLEAPLAYRIMGDNLDTLKVYAARLEQVVHQTQGAIYVNNPARFQPTDLKVVVNKQKAGLLGVPVSEIDRTVRMGIAGLNIGYFRPQKADGRTAEYDISISIPNPDPAHPVDFGVFDRLYVSSVNGVLMPLRQFANVEMVSSPAQIRHYDKTRYVTITADVLPGYLTDAVNREVVRQLPALQLPEGYSLMVAGEQENKEKSFGGLGTIILITAFGFIGILVLEFQTFKSTLIVLSVIPLGIIGAILILLVSGQPFSFVAVIGLIALVGIEVKNSILLVDFTNQLREDGKSLEEAIRLAGQIRFVPIVLTSLTAIGGLIPLVVEFSPLYSPLALVIIGGLISSTLLSRLVTPVMYKLLPPRIEVTHTESAR